MHATPRVIFIKRKLKNFTRSNKKSSNKRKKKTLFFIKEKNGQLINPLYVSMRTKNHNMLCNYSFMLYAFYRKDL